MAVLSIVEFTILARILCLDLVAKFLLAGILFLSLQAVFLYVVKPLPDPSLICRLDFCSVADGEHDSRSVGCNSKKDECFTLGTLMSSEW